MGASTSKRFTIFHPFADGAHKKGKEDSGKNEAACDPHVKTKGQAFCEACLDALCCCSSGTVPKTHESKTSHGDTL